MKISKKLAFGPLVLLVLSCRTGGTEMQPIVIDLSATKAPSPAASPTPAATATPVPPSITAAPAPPHEEPPASAHSESSSQAAPERIAQSRIEAYNRRDLEALVGLYAADAQVYEPPDRLRDSGVAQIRQTFARRFASAPGAKIMVAQRMIQGNFVVDRQTETGATGQSESALVISEIRDGKIVRVWTLR